MDWKAAIERILDDLETAIEDSKTGYEAAQTGFVGGCIVGRASGLVYAADELRKVLADG